MKAINFLKQTFPLALGLNHLAHLRESLYLLSLINSALLATAQQQQEKKALEARRDHAASLFLHTDQFIKQKQSYQATSVCSLVDFDPHHMITTQCQADAKLRQFLEEQLRDLIMDRQREAAPPMAQTSTSGAQAATGPVSVRQTRL